MRKRIAFAKTKAQISFAVTAKLISAFVFATRIVQFLFYLNPKFQASSSFLSLYRPVCVGPGRKPRRPVFSRRGSISKRSLNCKLWRPAMCSKCVRRACLCIFFKTHYQRVRIVQQTFEPRREKTGLRGFRPGPTQIGLYKLRKELEACNFGFKKKRKYTIRVAKTKALISFAVTAKLICAFVFA